MGRHSPDRVHWAKVFKLIQEKEPNGIAIYDIATEMDKEKGSEHLDAAIRQLVRQGRIRIVMGRDSKGMPAQMAFVKHGKETKRDSIAGRTTPTTDG